MEVPTPRSHQAINSRYGKDWQNHRYLDGFIGGLLGLRIDRASTRTARLWLQLKQDRVQLMAEPLFATM